MDFLRKLFGGGAGTGTGEQGDRDGMYFYVQPNGCDEIVRVRVNRMNDLSETDDGTGYWVRKHVRGVRCRQGVDLELYFDLNRRMVAGDAQGGKLVDAEAYAQWQASHGGE